MERVRVELGGERGYEIVIGGGAIGEIGGYLEGTQRGRKKAVVSDENVWGLYGERLKEAVGGGGGEVGVEIVRAGEGSKTMEGLTAVYKHFARMGIGRGDVAIACGGGVIGDLCGYAAATWMRGIGYIQVPTTLLSQVDSSVGGKTGINMEEGKNLVGAFHQPLGVYADTEVLETLDEREVRSGMAEVVKYGLIWSRGLYERVEKGEVGYTELIRECCRIKAEIVGADERDRGERGLLNFGHTFGHAIEKHYGYGRYTHGEGVAKGMVIAGIIGERAGITSEGTAIRIREMLERRGYEAGISCGIEELLPLIRMDKKAAGGGVELILLREIGKAEKKYMRYEEIARLLEGTEGIWKA